MRLGGSNKLLCAALQNSSLHIISYSASLLEARISCRYCGVFAFASGSYVIMPGQVMGGLDSGRRNSFFMNKLLNCVSSLICCYSGGEAIVWDIFS